jgi:quercetin dioxygenase-like cupin family protein
MLSHLAEVTENGYIGVSFTVKGEAMKHYKLNEIPEENVTDLFARRFFTGENITLAFLTLKQGCVVPQHNHDSEQFSYCISGALQFRIGAEELLLRAGEIVQIPPFVLHEAVAVEDFTGIDVFSPIRKDWADGSDHYLRQK